MNRRLDMMDDFVTDAVRLGAKVALGGERIEGDGNFYLPTVLRDVPDSAKVMNEEPFGPLAQFSPFSSMDEVIERANRLPWGLASYVFTRSAAISATMGEELETGCVGINHTSVHEAETPFGGVNEFGYGSESGMEGLDAYLRTKFVAEKRV